MLSRRDPFVVVALTFVVICTVFCLLPSRLDAAVTQWWSADLQPATATAARSYTGSAGDVWNLLTVAHWGAVTTNPSWTLTDHNGTVSAVNFSITGGISSFNGSLSGGTGGGGGDTDSPHSTETWSGDINPIGGDYFLWFGGSGTSNPIQFQFSGLTPGEKYELTLLGSSQYNDRDFNARVDANGNGSLDDEVAVRVSAENWNGLLTTTIGNGLIINDPPPHIPPYATFLNITASASGTIFGDGIKNNLEANWGGFQLREISDVPVWLPGDANKDGTVNGADLNTVLSNYNVTGTDWEHGDFDNNGTVNGADLNTVLSNYNQTGGGVAAAVPEPSTPWLAATTLAGLLAYGRRKRK